MGNVTLHSRKNRIERIMTGNQSPQGSYRDSRIVVIARTSGTVLTACYPLGETVKGKVE